LKKEIEEETRRWKDLPCSWISRINIMKMAVSPKPIYTYNVVSINISMTFFTEIRKSTTKFIWKHKRPCIVSNSKQKE
jgi:hypothetical protein